MCPAEPLPVRALEVSRAEGGALRVTWAPAEGSVQDEYRVSYHEAESADGSTVPCVAAGVTLDALLPGRNYTVGVRAVSRGVRSNETRAWCATQPLAPLVLSAAAGDRELRLTWRSDVNSRQDEYRVRYARLADPEPRDWIAVSTLVTNIVVREFRSLARPAL